jgi:hypothetical protein
VVKLATAHEADAPFAVRVIARFVAIRDAIAHYVPIEFHGFIQVMDLDADVLIPSDRRWS